MAFREIQLTNVATTVAEVDDPLLRINASETGTNTADTGFVFESVLTFFDNFGSAWNRCMFGQSNV